MNKFSDFTRLYPLSKTLRFELIPQGRTLEHITREGFLEKDESRAEKYILVKKIIDEYHKDFITKALWGLQLDNLQDYYLYYQIFKKNEEEKKKFDEIQTKLRKQIADQFTKHPGFKNLFAKELIKIELKSFVSSEEEKKLVEEFDNFTTYFTGFHENRRNMYSAEDKASAIAYRLIHQNLPKFLDNMHAFERVKNSPVKSQFPVILSDDELGPIIQVNEIEEMFSLDFFNETLSQTGIEAYNYLIGGYTTEEGNRKIQGLNEYINLYNQTASRENRLPKLKPLYKQILSDRSTVSFIPEEFLSDNEVLESIEKFYREIKDQVLDNKMKGEHSLKELLQNLKEYDLTKIHLRNDQGLADISQKSSGSWQLFERAVNQWFDLNYKGKSKVGTEKYEEDRRKFFRDQDSFSIAFLNDCLLLLDLNPPLKVEKYFELAGKDSDESSNVFEQIEADYGKITDLLNNPYPKESNLAQCQSDVDRIKALLDSFKSLQWFVKSLLGTGQEPEKDERFYGEFLALWTILDQITPLYNKVRNYMTRKPYSTEKVKLNFENSTLLDGWDVNKEPDNTSLIFRKNGLYYLGIMNKKHNKLFKKEFVDQDGPSFEKMDYKLLPGANKMLPKVFFSNSRIEEFYPGAEIMANYTNETHKKGANFNLADCHALIDFFKQSIEKHEDWRNFGFKFSETKTYEDLSGFYREVEQQGYKLTFKSIPDSNIDQLVDEGKLYLFQIYNKDFSPKSKGTPNMHTVYWNMLFDAVNLKDVVYKLNGQAEIFYRKSSIHHENRIIHTSQTPITNKNELNVKKQSVFEYDIIKDRRYTVDKFQFHVPITMNFKARGLSNINSEVNQFLKKQDDFHIIGIDRGERHLLYLCLIDSSGRIKKQFSLNEIVNEYEGKTYLTNYHHLLDKKEGNRDEARRNWKTIETIKELKEGYLSQVIHKISELMVEYKAIVVLEDLNMGFMRGRQKVEKQVYQKFEQMLIDKLNFLVDKKKTPSEPGGALHAYQLTNKFESFQKMGKQSGFLFYVPAWNTSKMDPVTGFVNLFETRYENIEKAKSFFGNFNSIRFNETRKYFEFEFEYSNFTNKAEGTRTRWTLCTHQSRIETFRNPEKNSQWDNREVFLTEDFIRLFEQYGINYRKNEELKPGICKQTDKTFFGSLLHLLKLTLQMRNSISGTDTDYLISPVANQQGIFYDSRSVSNDLPNNADANGAYNIARKGLCVEV